MHRSFLGRRDGRYVGLVYGKVRKEGGGEGGRGKGGERGEGVRGEGALMYRSSRKEGWEMRRTGV